MRCRGGIVMKKATQKETICKISVEETIVHMYQSKLTAKKLNDLLSYLDGLSSLQSPKEPSGDSQD